MPNEFARFLRKHETEAERALWRGLREFKKRNLHFRRQAPFGRYVADFACHRAKLIVELDGDQHGEDKQMLYDDERTRFLELSGSALCELRGVEGAAARAGLHPPRRDHPDRR